MYWAGGPEYVGGQAALREYKGRVALRKYNKGWAALREYKGQAAQ